MRRRDKDHDSEPPAPLRPEAFHGLAGKIVRAIEPNTEAAPAALLIQFLAAFGFVVGRRAFFLVEGAKHFPNLFVAVAGATSRSKKGTSWSQIRSIFELLKVWPRERVKNGLSSGEGLIEQVKDSAADARLLIVQSEFGSVLRVMTRPGNTLSPVLRDAWDGTGLHVITKKSPAHASSAHIALIGHITCEEIVELIDPTDLLNGFANRFLWCHADRVRLLPHGGVIDAGVLQQLVAELEDAVQWACGLDGQRIKWDDSAKEEWSADYPRLSQALEDARLDAVISRAPAQVVRLTLIFALLDKLPVILVEHLRAAVALWDYCEASARYIFGGTVGDEIAEEILSVLRLNPGGLARTAISGVFSRHCSSKQINRALWVLEQRQLARKQVKPTAGRPLEKWFAVVETCESSEESEPTPPKNRGANLLKFSDDEDLEFEPFDE